MSFFGKINRFLSILSLLKHKFGVFLFSFRRLLSLYDIVHGRAEAESLSVPGQEKIKWDKEGLAECISSILVTLRVELCSGHSQSTAFLSPRFSAIASALGGRGQMTFRRLWRLTDR